MITEDLVELSISYEYKFQYGTMVPSSMDKLSQNKIHLSIWHNYVCTARLRAPIELQESFSKIFSWGSENMYYFVKISTANITNDTLALFLSSIRRNYVCMARLRAPIDLQELFRKIFSWGSENYNNP